jgi:hypothetical protein
LETKLGDPFRWSGHRENCSFARKRNPIFSPQPVALVTQKFLPEYSAFNITGNMYTWTLT